MKNPLKRNVGRAPAGGGNQYLDDTILFYIKFPFFMLFLLLISPFLLLYKLYDYLFLDISKEAHPVDYAKTKDDDLIAVCRKHYFGVFNEDPCPDCGSFTKKDYA